MACVCVLVEVSMDGDTVFKSLMDLGVASAVLGWESLQDVMSPLVGVDPTHTWRD